MPHSQARRRKVAILTLQGFRKLQAAISRSYHWNPDTQSCPLEALSEQTGLSPQTLSKVHARQANVDFRTLVRYFHAFNLTLDTSDYCSPGRVDVMPKPLPGLPFDGAQTTASPSTAPAISWGIAPDVSEFYGRAADLNTLQSWVLDPRCRLVILVGMGGIGKTWLATKLAELVQCHFQIVVWRSLRPLARSPHLPRSFNDFIDDLICHLAPQSNPQLPETTHAKMRLLIDYLCKIRCLLVLDHVESVLQGYPSRALIGSSATEIHHHGYEDYAELLQCLSQGRHQSCVVLTSREEPKTIQQLAGDHLSSRVLPLQGLQLADAQRMFRARGSFHGSPTEWSQLITYYGGNPLVLGMLAVTILQVFAGNLTAFFSHNTLIFDEIRELLDQQFGCLSHPEQVVMKVLADQDTCLAFADLRSHISPTIPTAGLLAALKSLTARSLIEKSVARFSLQPLLKDYVRERHPIQQSVTRSMSDLAAIS